MAETFGIISAALSFAFQLEQIVESISNDLKDAKEFGSSLEKARLEMQWETERMRDMRVLLFGQSDRGKIAKGVTFGDFDRRTQLAILNILRRFSELLALNYKIVEGRYSAMEPSAGMILNTSLPFEKFQNGSLAKRLRWGFRDKKKLEKVLQELRSWNDRLFARIQMSFIRLDSQHQQSRRPQLASRPSALMMEFQTPLSSRKENVEAGKLGLSDDVALLQLASASSSLQLPALRITDFTRWTFGKESSQREAIRNTAQIDGRPLLLEYKEYLPDLKGQPAPAVERRVEQLGNILHSQKSDRYHTLSCRGYYLEESNQRFVFVFDVPEGDHHSSLATLHQDLVSQKQPALEDRFVIARTLAMSLSQLFAVGWVHKSFRSGNVVYFRNPSESSECTWPKPYILGLEYARPSMETSSRLIDRDDIAENIYRHPEQWGLPTVSFNVMHDIYALGVVLLEIGLWRQAVTLSPSHFRGPQTGMSVKHVLTSNASRLRLRASMGRRYQEVVLKCLRGDFGEFEGDQEDIELDFLERFNAEVIDVLDDIVQNL